MHSKLRKLYKHKDSPFSVSGKNADTRLDAYYLRLEKSEFAYIGKLCIHKRYIV